MNHHLKQLELFATTLPPDVPKSEDKFDNLLSLLNGDLDFRGVSSGYASHHLHSFAAKFPPQLPSAFIRALTNAGDTVLDPMMGSGTTIVEALLERRHAVGVDIDPLALRLCRVKTTPLDLDALRQAHARILNRASRWLADQPVIDQALDQWFDVPTRKFVDYWFLPDTQRQLAALRLAVDEESDPAIRDFLELTFSSIIIAKSAGVSRARDLAHSRPHRDEKKNIRNALDLFNTRFTQNAKRIDQFSRETQARLIAGDARTLPLADATVDLIVTSPPYANAIDYMRAHKFSLVWFGSRVDDLSDLRAQYIGAERVIGTQTERLTPLPEAMITQLETQDRKKAAVLRKYYSEMRQVIRESYRVLKPNAAAVIVVGTSTMRGIDVLTHTCLAEIAQDAGFTLAKVAQRAIDRDKRMMPARFGKKSDSIIEQRMHEEFVIGLYKEARHADTPADHR
jgi:DNA modification methylase